MQCRCEGPRSDRHPPATAAGRLKNDEQPGKDEGHPAGRILGILDS